METMNAKQFEKLLDKFFDVAIDKHSAHYAFGYLESAILSAYPNLPDANKVVLAKQFSEQLKSWGYQ